MSFVLPVGVTSFQEIVYFFCTVQCKIILEVKHTTAEIMFLLKSIVIMNLFLPQGFKQKLGNICALKVEEFPYLAFGMTASILKITLH